MRVAIVTTTIHVPRLLDGYVQNLARFGHEDVGFVIVGDHKTPPEIEAYLADLRGRCAYPIDYWDVPRQQAWLKRFPALDALLPYNCVQRRNLAYLVAAEAGAEVIITIDDDNHATDDDFVGHHAQVGQTQALTVIHSETGWFNPCELVATSPSRRIYHRGFPHSLRWKNDATRLESLQGRLVTSAGFWLNTPDVDAVTHLEEPLQVIGLQPLRTEGGLQPLRVEGDLPPWGGRGGPESLVGNESLALGHGTWAPFNSQNTAFAVDLLAPMYLIVMNDALYGLKMDRYDDIWMSYFCRVLTDHLGDYARIGRPLVRQDRNPHDYVRDLARELPGMMFTEKLVVTLRELRPTAGDYTQGYLELAHLLREAVHQGTVYTDEERAFVQRMTQGMLVWTDVCQQVTGQVQAVRTASV